MKKRDNAFEFKRLILMGVISMMALVSCVKEGTVQPADKETDVIFSLVLPGRDNPASRALSEATENMVGYIDVLIFNRNGDYVDIRRRGGSDITTEGGDIRKKTFTVTLPQGDYDLVLLANARDLTTGSYTGKNRAAVLAMITADVTDKWPSDGTRLIPMWGEVLGQTISKTTDLTGANSVRITRMVARVDVAVTATNFRLSSVRVYNYNKTGFISPVTTLIPNVPTATGNTTRGPLLYSGTAITTNKICAAEIYLFEAENHTGTGHTTAKALTDRTCLVIGGIYDANGNGNFTDDGGQSYYRVDFSNGSEATYLDVLRNHHYTFSITKVSDYGFSDPDDAFNYTLTPTNIVVTVAAWTDKNMNQILQ